MIILSLCTSAGLWDKALIERGHEVIPGCEIMEHKRKMYRAFCQDEKHIVEDIRELPFYTRKIKRFDGIIGGIPCQSRSKLKSIRKPKFGDLLPYVRQILDNCEWDWALFENVSKLDIPGFKSCRLNAANFGKPHQSRARYFTYSPNLEKPDIVYPGSVDDLFAYSVVAGRIYGPKRGAKLQGWPEFSNLNFPCVQLQEALADGLPRCLSDAWADKMEEL
jgi:hypothetical protein